jgi:acetolactate synthase-1/2/3 large subunit
MKANLALMKILEDYNVNYIFGLPGETSLLLYDIFEKSSISHIMARDERNTIMMADGYARVSYKPGIAEVPGVAASYILPGLSEAKVSSIPIIVIISDTSNTLEKTNVLTEYDKNSMFFDVTKDFLNVNSISSLPRLVRRAFREATSGIPGPVVLRIPENIYEMEINQSEIYGQKEFSNFPAIRMAPEEKLLEKAVDLLDKSQHPVIICGQGVLLSMAWNEVSNLSELLNIPVGTTITGKGSISDFHPNSIGVIGNRGGTSFSNAVVQNSDLIFYMGSNTDYAGTNAWSTPSLRRNANIIHLDINESNLGNMYHTELFLQGDVKLTLQMIIKIVKNRKLKMKKIDIKSKKEDQWKFVESLIEKNINYVNPISFIRNLEKIINYDVIIVADVGTSAIYTSAYFRVKKPGRSFIYNYSIGGLGFGLGAAIGAYFASKKMVILLTSDGNIGFNMGELETIRRTNANVKVILMNNRSFGWIRAALLSRFEKDYKEGIFSDIDYLKIADGFGLKSFLIEKNKDLNMMTEFLRTKGPAFLEMKVLPENEVFPPVPSWRAVSEKNGKIYLG